MAQSILLNTDQLVQKNCNGRVQMRKPYMGKFSVKRRADFLDHLAATCNVKVAAENSGVSPSAAYQWRRRDAVFAEQWQDALETGYACLETMLLVYKAGSATTRMAAENVIHIRTMHPLDDHYGLGCLGAASGAVAIHNAAAKWNKALLDNAARPSGALTYDTGDAGALSGEQFDRLRSELDASFAGAMNAGRPMLLEGGLKWQALSMSPADMDFVALKEGAAREIALAFGVPPMLMGLPGDATYSNYREANKALWRQSILPLADKILTALGQGLKPWFDGVMLGIDQDKITALAEDRERLCSRRPRCKSSTCPFAGIDAGYTEPAR
jgi:phage portal protein BeeE